MNELTSVGLILLFALGAGHLVKVLRIPEVTGYIFAGVFVGPSVLDWITHENLQTLEVFSQVALGLILFSIGSVFEFSRFRRIGNSVIILTAVESALAFFLVAGAIFAAGQSWQVSALLGAIAIETAAASTLMVMRECNSEGPLTETLTAIIALNNILALLVYSAIASGIEIQIGGAALESLYVALYPLVWQLLGSVALGYLIGILLSSWASQVVEHGETLILLTGCVLLCVGGALVLDLSPLIASLAVGATMVNLSSRSRGLFSVLSRTDPPLYAIFFVIAGADLNLAMLPALGVLGGAYILGRAVAKFFGASLVTRALKMPEPIQRYLGASMLSQAGLAIGLVLITSRRFPEYAPTVNTVVLAAVAIFEIIGPIGARISLIRSGEARLTEAEVPIV